VTPYNPHPACLLLAEEEEPGDSLEGLVLGADVESDGPAVDVEGVEAVVLHHHLCIVLRPQLHKRLRQDPPVEINVLLMNPPTHNGIIIIIFSFGINKVIFYSICIYDDT